MTGPVSSLLKSGSALHLTSVDTLRWSHPEYSLRVRLNYDELPKSEAKTTEQLLANMQRRRSFKGLLQSNTKARRFHGYLEGNYALATFGFYTNNFEGVKKLYQKYPELFESVQRYDQYMSAVQLANFLTDTD